MNRLADSLLTLLLSWMRTLFSDILSLFNGSGAGILTWLQARWLSLAVVLLLAGLTIDAVIYIIRWRPQYVWRTRLQHLFHRSAFDSSEPAFETGYTDALADFNFEDTPIQDLSSGDTSLSDRLEQYYSQPVSTSSVQDNAAEQRRNRRIARYNRRVRRGYYQLGNAERIVPTQEHSAFHEPIYPAMPQQDNTADTLQDADRTYE